MEQVHSGQWTVVANVIAGYYKSGLVKSNKQVGKTKQKVAKIYSSKLDWKTQILTLSIAQKPLY